MTLVCLRDIIHTVSGLYIAFGAWESEAPRVNRQAQLRLTSMVASVWFLVCPRTVEVLRRVHL